MAIRKRLNITEQRRLMASTAMPEVKRLVKRFGRVAVANCLGKIAASERAAKKVAAMKRELAALESKLR